jgi:hypothetical protein
MSKRRKSAVDTRLAASLSDPGNNLPKDSIFAELSGFVSGHRFSDAATRQLLTAPLGAKGRESKLRKMSTIILTLIVFAAAAALAGESSSNSNSNNQLSAGSMQEKSRCRVFYLSRISHHCAATPEQARLDQRSRQDDY